MISNPISVLDNGVVIKSSTLDLQELRANLLFWDVLDYPVGGPIYSGPNDDTKFLISTGVIERTKVSFTKNSNLNHAPLLAFLEAFRYREEEEPGIWSLSTGENSIDFPYAEKNEGRGVLVKLVNAIPVPDKDVPLAEILEFKEKRKAELLSLRHHLEETYLKIINAGDGPLALNVELEKLQHAISDHIKTSRETGFKLRLQDLSADLNLKELCVTALTAHQMGLTILNSMLTGAASSLSINISRSLIGREPSANPYRYVASFHNQLFV
mgnify:FL=1